MTPKQQRIKIAEAHGKIELWKNTETSRDHFCFIPKGHKPYTQEAQARFWELVKFSELTEAKTASNSHLFPDYLNDLNAMHEVVSIFDYDQADEFEDHLCDICKRANDKKENPAPWRFAVANATAEQRAEAFLKTLNLWTK